MNPDESASLGAEFLDDFYTECDEHLTAIREALVSLEPSVGKARPDAGMIEKLFRSFHSFKGNSAIIGLRPAEDLAHAAEDFLRELSRGHASMTSEGLDLLMNVAQRLEEVTAFHREGKTPPNVSPLIEQLERNNGKKAKAEETPTSKPAVARTSASSAQSVESARADGLIIWRFRFRPTRELDAKGVNVNTVRERIKGLGDILEARPLIEKNGVVFEFVAGLSKTPDDLASWERDGITSELGDGSNPASEPVAGQAEKPADPHQSAYVAPSHVVRVDLARLDELMRITGELVIHRARLDDQINRTIQNGTADPRILQEINNSIARALRSLREGIVRVRLVPITEIFARMPFVVRDLARESSKKVQLTFSGQDTEIDKYVVERLKDPLLHLVRNSVSHGIENPQARAAAGKPEQGTLFLRASTVGDTVVIEVGDDGSGIDAEAVKIKARQYKLPVDDTMSNAALLNLICSPGFSTRDEADRAAGRGIGMEVVQNTVRELGGTLSLETAPGEGTRFILRLPLTLAIADVMIVSAQNQTCAIPQSFVREVMHLEREKIRHVNHAEVIPYREGVLPLLRLRRLFGFEEEHGTRDTVLVLNSEQGITGLVVDRIRGQREVVVRNLSDPLVQVAGVAGATELGDGRPVLILDAMALTSGVVRPRTAEETATPITHSMAIAN